MKNWKLWVPLFGLRLDEAYDAYVRDKFIIYFFWMIWQVISFTEVTFAFGYLVDYLVK